MQQIQEDKKKLTVKEIQKIHFEAVVLHSPKPVLLEYGATWCGPCKLMRPVLEEISDEFQEFLDVVTLDADENPELLARYKIKSIPTMLLFKDGIVVKTLVGAKPKALLIQELNLK